MPQTAVAEVNAQTAQAGMKKVDDKREVRRKRINGDYKYLSRKGRKLYVENKHLHPQSSVLTY